jgi:hypothetical protein
VTSLLDIASSRKFLKREPDHQHKGLSLIALRRHIVFPDRDQTGHGATHLFGDDQDELQTAFDFRSRQSEERNFDSGRKGSLNQITIPNIEHCP